MFVRRLFAAVAMCAAVLVPTGPALAAPADKAPGGVSRAVGQWIIEGSYPSWFDCENRGGGGLGRGEWTNYYCEDDVFSNNYLLWVELQASQTGPCTVRGHAYVINGGALYFSGYQGNHENGISTVHLPSAATIALGGNGIKPGTAPRFTVKLGGAVVHDWTVNSAGGNCVSNQVNRSLSLQPGTLYEVTVTYTAGNNNPYTDTVAYLQTF